MGFGLVSCVSVFYILLIGATGKSDVDSENLPAYELLESYGFPAGLLPSTVKAYSLESNGEFVLYLDATCQFTVPSAYPVRYASTITGKISYQLLRDLRGVSVKVFLFWLNIDAIYVSGNDLVFQVGPLSASYPITNFNENPGCDGINEDPLSALD